MYAIEEKSKTINRVRVTTFQREVEEESVLLEAEAGTTGYTGAPCQKAGARAFLRINKVYGNVEVSPVLDEEGRVSGVAIYTCGDEGLSVIMKALEFIQNVFQDQILERNE